jgi:hypothetical protein
MYRERVSQIYAERFLLAKPAILNLVSCLKIKTRSVFENYKQGLERGYTTRFEELEELNRQTVFPP